MKKIGIIGHFGGQENFSDGQTIKTKNLKMLLEDYNNLKTRCVDTYLVRSHKVRLLFESVACLFLCEDIFILLSENGMRFYLWFLYWANKVFRRRIYHYIIGSEILEMTKADARLVKYLNALKINWFEYDSGTLTLKALGVTNVQTLPNCKVLNAVKPETIAAYVPEDRGFSFCTFSRVMEEKGITEAISVISQINKTHGKAVAHLDVYGQIDETYREKFETLLAQYREDVTYKGLVDSRKSVDVLKEYYALLFPTRWPGEGFPGTILDAYASGLPVIASDWNANKELIDHMRTGILYPRGELNHLESAVRWSVENSAALNQMRHSCREEYEKYTPEQVGNAIMKEIG